MIYSLILVVMLTYSSFTVASADITATLKQLYSDGEFLYGGTAADVSSIQPPPFSIADSFEADVPNDSLYLKANGYPQKNVVNFYLLWPESLAVLGLEDLDNCLAQKVEEYRFIFCNGPSFLKATKEFDLALNPGDPATFTLARLILGHELIHHILRHTDQFKDRAPSRAQLRTIEREADVATTQMFAERFQRERLYSYFFPKGKKLTARGGSVWPRWLDKILQIGSTHVDWETRIRSHVTRSTEVFVDAKDYRGFEPARIGLLDSRCTDQRECSFPKEEPTMDQLTSFWFRQPLHEREAIAETVVGLRTKKGFDSVSSYPTMAMMCQALIFTQNEDQCAPIFDVYQDGTMDIFDVVPYDEQVFGLQTMMLLRPETASDASDLIERIAAFAVDPLYRAWYEHKAPSFSPVYSYLSFLRGENSMVNCGADGEGFRLEGYYDCGKFATEVQAQLGNNTFSSDALFNIGLMLDIDNDRHQVLLVTLAALALTEPSKQAPMSSWINLLSSVSPELIASPEHRNLLPLPQIFFQIGMTSMALPYLEYLDDVLPKLIPNQLGLGQAWVEFGSDCLDVYMASCAIEQFNRAEIIHRNLLLDDDPSLRRSADVMLSWLDFQYARSYILKGESMRAVALLEEELKIEERIFDKIGILETIAEAHIMNCDGPSADAALQKAEALFDDPEAERNQQRRAMSAGYRNSINFLLREKSALIESRQHVDTAYEAWIGLTPSGLDPMIGICNGYRRFNSLILE